MHYTEGTKYYDKLNEELWKIALDENAPESVKAKIGDMQKRSDSLWKDYKNQLKGKTSAEKRALIESERNAYLVQDLISEQYVIDRLAQKNEGLVKKLLAKIKALANKSAKVDSEATKYLNKLVKSFEKAIDNAHGGVSLNSIGNADEEKDGEIIGERYSFNKYSDKQKENWKNSKNIVIYESETQFKNFINEAITNKQYHKKMYFGAISSELADIIHKNTGINVEGFNCSLQADEIRKIFKDHGNEEKERPRGQRAITEDDILNIPKVIQSPDKIVKSPRLYDGKPVIDFSKNIIEKMTVSAIVSDKHLDLRVQTAYVGIKKGNLATPIDEQASNNTPKASRGTVSTNSITESGENVKKGNKNILDERYSYAGRRAKTANRSALENAEKMLAEGVDAETIRKETGWFMGYDKKWRFEIDDSQMKVNSDTSNYTTLDKLIEHEALFSAYPELRQLRITFSDLRESRGSYDRRFGDISIDYSLKGDAENLKMLLIHEIQHAIQDIESFARGASPEFWENKIAQGFDSRTVYVKQQEAELLEKIKKKRHENRDFIEDIEFLIDSTPTKPRGKVDWETLEQIEEDPPEWKSFDRWREKLEKTYGRQDVYEYMEAISNLERLRQTTDRYDGYALYMFTAGEIEARDTASRLELDAEQRKNNRPNIDEEVVVFAEDSVVSREIKYPVFSEKDIDNNMVAIAHMKPVITIDASKLEKTGKTPKSIFEEYFESLGKTIYSPIYGDISLGNSSVKSEIRHGITATKIASIEAIPTVIEKGKVIFHLRKYGGVERIVICAPIKISQDNYYMGVMLQRDAQTQYLYLHNVVIEKEMLDTSKTHLVTTGVNEENKHLSISSILQKAINVKKNIENGIEERHSKKRSYNPAEDTDVDDEGNIWVDDSTVSREIKYPVFSEKDIDNNITKIISMDSVKTVQGTEFKKGDIDLITQVEEYFATFNYEVTNDDLGEVLIDRRGIKNDIAHGIGRKKAATFMAVPDVIQKGKIVDYQQNWKDRGYDTAVIVAPITIEGEKHYMGVVVIQSKKNNRFYVHEVAAIRKEGVQPFKTGPIEKNSNAGGDTPSIISILQKIVNYNSQNERYSKKRSYVPTDEVKNWLEDVFDIYVDIGIETEETPFIAKEAKKDIISAIWKKMNSTSGFNKKKFAYSIANKILENTILAYGSVFETDKLLKSFMHRIDLSEVVEGVDKDSKRKINARWALRDGYETISTTDVVMELSKLGYQISSTNLLDALYEIDSVYETTKKYISEENGEKLKNIMGEEKYKTTQKKIANDLLTAFDEMQTENELAGKLAFIIEQSQKELRAHREYKQEFKSDENRVRAVGVILHQVKQLKDIKDHKYKSAQQPKFDEFKGIIQSISKRNTNQID